MNIEGRNALGLDGFATEPGTFTTIPSGEAAIVPLEGTTQGVTVFDHAIDNVGVLDAPVRAEVRGGRIVRIDGGRSAGMLRDLLTIDEHAPNIAEFAIGTNPKSRLLGNMAEDKILLGTVHIGIGDSHTIGGTVESRIHLDGIVLNPTVEVDGQKIVEVRRMLVET
jgi:leucyl aminopeptidase (aminopeptidase T)